MNCTHGISLRKFCPKCDELARRKGLDPDTMHRREDDEHLERLLKEQQP